MIFMNVVCKNEQGVFDLKCLYFVETFAIIDK